DAVHLEGSINAAPDAANRAGLMPAALRALVPLGVLHLHGLAGDRRCPSPISLPGAAAAVQYVPAVEEVVNELTRAGFVDVDLGKLSWNGESVVAGVQLRELRIVARRPGARAAAMTHEAIYLGPMAQVVDDAGTIFRRGVATPIDTPARERLGNGSMKSD